MIFRCLSAMVIAALLLAGLPAHNGKAASSVWYVKPGAVGDCSSWAAACDLLTALEEAEAGDEIWMAQGTYKPSATADREASFNLVSDVALYGGYSSDGSVRNPELYPSILSGDYNDDDDDATEFQNHVENAHHVVKANAVTDILLDGLTITGGSADGEVELGQGGGFYTNASTLTLKDVIITGNTAITGAGMFNNNSTLDMEDVSFVFNWASGMQMTNGGGGLYNSGTTLTLEDITFEQNFSYRGGGVVLENSSYMAVIGGTFKDNIAFHHNGNHFDSKNAGGAILSVTGSVLLVDGTTFTGNRANDGGAITTMYTNPVIRNATFIDNIAAKPDPGYTIYGGGGGFFGHGGSPTLVNVQFISNEAEYGGGSDTYLAQNARYTNVAFIGNSAVYGGGYSHTHGTAAITNATFAKNNASDSGGGIWNMDAGNLVVNNSIIWGNTAPNGPGQYNADDSPSNTIISECSVLQDCMVGGAWVSSCGTESDTNLYTDPLFVDLASNNVRLQSGSPAIDTGCNELLPPDTADLDNDGDTSEPLPLDLDGNARIVNDPSTLPDENIVDRGAFERSTTGLTAHDLVLQPNEDSVVNDQVEASGGTGLTFTVETPPSVTGQAFTFAADGSFSYTPPQDRTGPVTFTFKVTDSLLNTDTGLVTMNFQPVNDPPVNTVLPTISGTPHVGKLLTAAAGTWNDTRDGGTSTITYAYQWQRANDATGAGLVDIAGAAAQTYTPVLADNGKYLRVKVTGTDNGVGQPPAQSATAFSAYLLIANAAPVANDLEIEQGNDVPVEGQVTATDPDGDSLTFAVGTGPASGTLNFNADGSFTHTPTPNFTGDVTFTFTVSDGLGGTDNGTVTITYVPPVNDPPVNTVPPTISGTPHVGKPLTATAGTWNDDKDGGTSTITYAYQWQRANDAAGAGLVDIAGAATLNYTPVLADNGKYLRIKVTATDDGVGLPPTQSATAFSAYLLIANAAPVANDLEIDQLIAGETAQGQVTATDPDGDSLTFAVANGPVSGTLTLNPIGSFTYTPAAGFDGEMTFTFTVSDGLGGTDTGTVALVYEPANDPPVNTVPPTISGTPHVGKPLTATAGTWNDDLDGGTSTITYAYQWQRANDAAGAGLVDIAGAATLNYTPVLADNGKYLRIKVTATDDGVGLPPTQSATAFSAYLLIANAAPVTADLEIDSLFDEVITEQVTATDVDGDDLTFNVDDEPAVGTLDFDPDGSFTYTPPAGYLGDVTFTFTVSDGLGGTDTGTVTITFLPVNDPPVNTVLPSIIGTAHVGKTLTATDGVWNDDLDGGTSIITYTYQWQRSDDAAGTNPVDIAGATAKTYVPVLADNGKYVGVKVTATDDGVGLPPTQSASASSAFVPVDNDAPDAADLALELKKGKAAENQVTATDPDGDELTFSVDEEPAVGTLVFDADGSFVYTPPADFTGDVTFTFTVSDGLGGSDTGTVTLTYTSMYYFYLPIIFR